MNTIAFIKNEYTKNLWVKDKNLEIYVRKRKRLINDKFSYCLDIANISTTVCPGKGNWKRYIKKLRESKEILQFNCIYVENILSPIFEEWFIKNRWNKDSTTIPCFYIHVQ